MRASSTLSKETNELYKDKGKWNLLDRNHRIHFIDKNETEKIR